MHGNACLLLVHSTLKESPRAALPQVCLATPKSVARPQLVGWFTVTSTPGCPQLYTVSHVQKSCMDAPPTPHCALVVFWWVFNTFRSFFIMFKSPEIGLENVCKKASQPLSAIFFSLPFIVMHVCCPNDFEPQGKVERGSSKYCMNCFHLFFLSKKQTLGMEQRCNLKGMVGLHL